LARIGLPHLTSRLVEAGYEVTPHSSRRAWNAAVQGLFPAHFESNRWTVDEADLDKVAAALGLTRGDKTPAKKRARAA